MYVGFLVAVGLTRNAARFRWRFGPFRRSGAGRVRGRGMGGFVMMCQGRREPVAVVPPLTRKGEAATHKRSFGSEQWKMNS